MSRRLNFTHRQRVRQDEVGIQIVSSSKHLVVDVAIDLSRLVKAGLSPSFPVFLEAYHDPQSERLPLGTVGTLAGVRRLAIPSFGAEEPVLFRLKVVDNDKIEGRLAAFCNQIRPKPLGEHETESLLDVKVAPIEGEVFRLDLPSTPYTKPVLLLSEALDLEMTGGIKTFALTPMFVALVLPQVIRQVLTNWLKAGSDDGDDGDGDDEAENQPRAQWLTFARFLTGTGPPETDDEVEVANWIDEVVASFSRRNDIAGRFKLVAEAK